MQSKTVLITGANRGIGLGLVKYHLDNQYHVIATCRHPNQAQTLQHYATKAGDRLDILPLEVMDPQQIINLTQQIGKHPIDRLILNAGIYGHSQQEAAPILPDEMIDVFKTNALAPISLATHLLDAVSLSKERLIVAITSKVSSIADNSSGGRYAYRGSKAALNAMMFSFSLDTEPRGIKTLILHPGWVKTDMGGDNALIDVETSVNGLANIMAQANHYQNGAFMNYDGTTIPW